MISIHANIVHELLKYNGMNYILPTTFYSDLACSGRGRWVWLWWPTKRRCLRCSWTMLNNSKHTEASYFPDSAGSAGFRAAYMPRSPQLVIFVSTTTDKPITLPLAHVHRVIKHMTQRGYSWRLKKPFTSSFKSQTAFSLGDGTVLLPPWSTEW